MSVMLITFELGKMDQAIERLHVFIKGYNHIRLSETSYAIETFEKTRTIFNKITPYLGKNSRHLVVTLSKPFSGVPMSATSEWLSKLLTEE